MKNFSNWEKLAILAIFALSRQQLLAEGQFLPVPELILSDGYPVEVHHVVTEDGYILELHRIPNGRNGVSSPSSGGRNNKPVVLFGHCIMCSSAVYVVLGPTRGLAYVMANLGFDVWMMNARGTEYSMNHISLSPESKEFWEFSWHELGIYDVSASIDYALQVTGETQVDYIGHSMGTTQFFVLMAERPAYNKKIRNMIALAPAVFFNNTSHRGAKAISRAIPGLMAAATISGNLQMPPPELELKQTFTSLCTPIREGLYTPTCPKLIRSAGGTNNGNINLRSLQFFFQYFPEYTSLPCMSHFDQIRKSGCFCKYDFGTRLNMKKYGTKKPPAYDLSKVTAPISLFWSSGDTTTSAADVARLRNTLPNVVLNYEVPFKKFSHVDYIWGKNAHKLVYEVIEKCLQPALTQRPFAIESY